ncbi:DUF1189 domain-containing protein [Mesobacillus jeotgali]|uniref:DUF1189 domain-containing protein n=1 Tax=Mesobacillus jeotgali TaxID=129985 RepID=UPI0009A8718E|nr:DUF1189 domain-containing protein [Mesobacillus jeotgali]
MNLFTQLAKSLYSPKDIALTRFQGIGKTILFVFLLTLISILPSIFYMFTSISQAIDSAKQAVETDIPNFSIEEGVLKSDIKAPVTLKKDNFTIIFDSTGAVEESDMTNMDTTFGMLEHEIVLTAGGQTNAIPYSLFTTEKISRDDALSLIKTADSALPVLLGILFIAIFVFSAGLKFIEVSLLALFGLLLKNLAQRNIQYRHLWRMAAYSTTLPTLFFTLMAFLKTAVPYNFAVNWFVASMMLLMAIKEIAVQKREEI